MKFSCCVFFGLLSALVTILGCERIPALEKPLNNVRASKIELSKKKIEPQSALNDSEAANEIEHALIVEQPDEVVMEPLFSPPPLSFLTSYIGLSSRRETDNFIADIDSDGVENRNDNCINIRNPDQTDNDNDGIGAVCDCDDDNASFGKNLTRARYVDPNGDDNENFCLDPKRPCRTIAHALNEASSRNTIVLARETFQEQALVIDKDIAIIGQGPSNTKISAQLVDRVFSISSGVEASFCGITITDGFKEGSSDRGGGMIILNDARVELVNVTISENIADMGGGISNEGELTIVNSRIIENLAAYGGGLYSDGGVVTINASSFNRNQSAFGGGIDNNESVLTIIDSTLDDNLASFGGAIESSLGTMNIVSTTISNNVAVFGGGIANISSVMSITNSTMSGNEAEFGGGIDNNSSDLSVNNSTINNNLAVISGGGINNSGTATIYHTILANNTPGDDCSNIGTITSSGFNLESASTCNFNQPGDLPNANAHFLPLADNGGLTRTHALGEASDAIDSGDTGCGVTTDQRGELRPVDFLGVLPDGGAPHCDIGSFEKQP